MNDDFLQVEKSDLENSQYFMKDESEIFCFYRIPKILFIAEMYRNLSVESKVLYGLLLDRIGISRKNNWIDEKNRVFIIYTIQNIMDDLGCGNKKASQLLKELENIGLIERRRRGLGKPNLIYVKKFISSEARNIQICQKDTSGNNQNIESNVEHFQKEPLDITRDVNKTFLDIAEQHTNNKDFNYNDLNNINQSFMSSADKNDEIDKNDEDNNQEMRDFFSDVFKINLDYSTLDEGKFKRRVEEVIEILVDVCCSAQKYLKINGTNIPHDKVVEVFRKIELKHVRHVFMSMDALNNPVKNVKQYLVVSLYNSIMLYTNTQNIGRFKSVDVLDRI